MDHDRIRPPKPSSFIEAFESMEEFESWCERGSIKDLQCTEDAFREYELWDYLVIIKKVKEKKLNKN